MNNKIHIFLSKWFNRIFAYFLGVVFLIFLYNIIFNIFRDFLLSWKYNFLIISFINFIIVSLPAFTIEQIRSGNFLKSLGLQFDKFTIRYLIHSFFYVFIPFLIIFIIGFSLEIIKLTNENVSIFAISQFIFISIFAVLQEEIFFRGVLLKYLNERFSTISSILIISIIFAVMHIFNPYISGISFISTIIAGILFSLMYIQTKALWLPIFYHLFWNIFSALLLGSPISGLSQYLFFFEMKTRTPIERIFLGNQYGIESGIATIIVLIITSYLIIKYESINPYFSSHNFRTIYNEDKIQLSK
jgi:membrane protease YdiL (CAAX protease family)